MSERFAVYPSLVGRAVLVSGGASGIGETMVRSFAGQGARVGFLDIDAENGAALMSELAAKGQRTMFIRCDVTDIAAYRTAIADLEAAYGPALVLVNKAANDSRHDWQEVTPEAWDARMAVNLKHAFFAIQAVAPGMMAAGTGSIINLGSIAWMIMSERIPVYMAAKAAMHGLSRAMARELGPHGIRVNTLAPGAVMTKRQLNEVITPEDEAQIRSLQALKARVLPEDVANMALFLAADDSQMITGQDFLVDGGWAHG